MARVSFYATHIKREETTLERQLIEEIRLFENNVNAITMTRIERKKKKKPSATGS